ncbi:MAG: LLM class flavin-dependent oxidoreductase [Acidimicrobiia bacterium]|nr:LLM class flavin-dependent oxidoreductase [Acidimicrobiia bacterium]
MRVAVALGIDREWAESVTLVREAEQMGVHSVWVPEAWGYDAAAPLGYLAARTSTIRIGSGIFQVDARSAVMTAQTAASLAVMTAGRFLLGLGVSGPQVMEGLHGVPFAHPLRRMRETVEVIRLALSGTRVVYNGAHIRLPRLGGEGKALRLAVDADLQPPIYLATLSPRMLELTGELADGWLGASFIPEASGAYLDHLAVGAERAGRSLEQMDLSQAAEVAFGDDVDEMVAGRKQALAFSLGGMGSAKSNFYNAAYARQGWSEVATKVQALWLEGRRADAAAAVPAEMVLQTALIGTESMVRDRLAVWQAAGVTTLRVYPAGETLDARVATLGRVVEMVSHLQRID